MLGDLRYHPLQIVHGKDPRDWLKAATWYRGKPFRTAQGIPSPNGNALHFALGWHFAIKTAAMRTSDIPDVRAGHNFDIALGEQCYQNGFSLGSYNEGKRYVATPPNGRRGFHETFPFYK